MWNSPYMLGFKGLIARPVLSPAIPLYICRGSSGLQEFYTKPDRISCLPRQVCTDLLEFSFFESWREIGPSSLWPNNNTRP